MDIVTYEELESVIDAYIKKCGKTILVIDGKCGSGKTTIAGKLSKKFDGAIVHMDDFFVPPSLRDEAHSEINVHYERFKEEVEEPLKAGKTVIYRRFDCSVMDYNGSVTVPDRKLLIIEGSYSLAPVFEDLGNIKLFIDCTYHKQLERIADRVKNKEKVDKFKTLWIPKENAYFEKFKIKDKADYILET